MELPGEHGAHLEISTNLVYVFGVLEFLELLGHELFVPLDLHSHSSPFLEDEGFLGPEMVRKSERVRTSGSPFSLDPPESSSANAFFCIRSVWRSV